MQRCPRLEDFVYITAVMHWLIPQFFNVVSLNNNTVHTINTPIHAQHMHDHAEFVQCPELATENGEVTISPENRPLNSKATYTCNKGYKVTGSRERYCQLDGTWNGTDTKCGTFLYTVSATKVQSGVCSLCTPSILYVVHKLTSHFQGHTIAEFLRKTTCSFYNAPSVCSIWDVYMTWHVLLLRDERAS